MLMQKDKQGIRTDSCKAYSLKNRTKFRLRKILKIILFLILFTMLSMACVFGYFYVKINSQYGNLQFDKDKLITATSYVQITDKNDNNIGKASINGRATIEFNQLKQHTVNAFIAIEDQQFYKHNGLNYKRMIKSFITNIKSGYAKEGASTISQQLIKNTHLNNDKTIERKLKEIFLTKKLEKTFSKDEILEIYLNVIYFGNSCFGIEEASNFYFEKSAKDLNIAESATLAGIIKSPKIYNPISNYNNCVSRRNLVLAQMKKCNFISNDEYTNATNKSLEVKQIVKQNSIEKLVVDDACKVLNKCERDLVTSNLKIKTTINPDLQKFIDSIDLSFLKINGEMPDYAIIVEKNADSAIQAIRFSNIDILNMKRQPASCLKPFLVYAPNFEDGKINLLTKIDDSPVNFDGFSPSNADKKYRGEISVTEALSKSSNICATKLLNYYGIDKAKKCAQGFGFKFDKKDNHLALALGSMYYGCDLFTLTNAYATLARNGAYIPTKIIENIYSNTLPLYRCKSEKTKATTPETAYQLTLALQECSNGGTGKKLQDFSKHVACKTGTNGVKNSTQNTDAYNISYSTDYTVCVWIGSNENKFLPANYNGGNHPSIVAKTIWAHLNPQKEFAMPQNIVEKNIDKITYDKSGQIKIADKNAPARYILTSKFNKDFLPTESSTLFTTPPDLVLKAKKANNTITLSFNCEKYYEYSLFKCIENDVVLLESIKNKNGQHYFVDTFTNNDSQITYYVVLSTPNNKKTLSNEIKILT